MSDGLYDERPAFYDAIQSAWPYERDVTFVEAVFERRDHPVDRLLDVGCGTGEHTCRLADRGYAVTAVDMHEAMLDRARSKCAATDPDGAVTFREATLPVLPLEATFDAAVAIRGVINHLPPSDLAPALSAVADRLVDGGVFVFDNSPLPPGGNHPAIDVGTIDDGEYARLSQHVPTDEGRLEWRSVTFAPDGEWFVDRRMMTPFADDRVATALREAGFTVARIRGYGPDDDRTVFVAVAEPA
ncbi:MAG: class I SAM-dependent methyltransferase [Halanaeroarchaeum sp.]